MTQEIGCIFCVPMQRLSPNSKSHRWTSLHDKGVFEISLQEFPGHTMDAGLQRRKRRGYKTDAKLKCFQATLKFLCMGQQSPALKQFSIKTLESD